MSQLWSYFKKIDKSNDVECLVLLQDKKTVCSKILHRKDTSTKGMKDHIRHRHKEIFDNLFETKKVTVKFFV